MEKMISVIVPTMWKANYFFFNMLQILEASDYVKEVIVIDNNPNECPKEEIEKFSKVTLFTAGKNLYFNRAINVGVELSSEEILCFLNDDVIFDMKVLEFVSKNIQKEHGMISPHPKYFNRINENQELIKVLKLEPTEKELDGFGCTMFVLRENFARIPQEIVFHWGDVFMYRMHEKLGRVNQTLHNWVVATPMRVTTAAVPEIGGIIQKDWEVAESVFNKYGLTTK
jgi:glycosyltransferase involved in cell wall biosynthesis